jgi:hypothetical protein
MEKIECLPTPQVGEAGPELSAEKLMLESGVVGGPAWRRHVLQPKAPTDFKHLSPEQSRTPASEEHNRTIEEFLETGTVSPKTEADFAHIGDRHVAAGAYAGHVKALDEIRLMLWREEDERKELLKDIERMRRERESPAAEIPAKPVEVRGQLLAPIKPLDRYGAKPLAPLEIERAPPERAAPIGEGTEMVDLETRVRLNDLLGECHFLMKEVAFRSICQARDSETRMYFLNAAMHLAETGAKVGDSAGRLRNGAPVSQTAHRMTVEKIVTKVGGPAGGGMPAP